MRFYKHTVVFSLMLVFGAFFATPHITAASELAGYWKFDEESGSTATDASGNGRNGTLTNVTRSTGTLPPIEFANVSSVFFNSGSSDRIVSTSLSLNNFTQFTMAGWMYPTAVNDRASLFGQNDIFEFGFTDGDTIFCYTSKGEVFWDFTPGTFLNNWHHITCLATASELIMYVDGVNRASTAISAGSFGSSGDNFSIGAGVVDGGTQGPFTGYIDDVRVYSRGLSPSEMEGLGNGESGPTNAPSIESTTPADNATSVSLTANLSLVFGTSTMATSTGSIGLYKTSDNALVESFAVTSSNLTRSAAIDSTTFTIDPSVTLQNSTEYYVWIPSTAFKDADDVFYEGTTASTTWSFTTLADGAAPTISNIATSSITNTGATITWDTDEAASTKVVYSADTNYASTTAEADTSPRVTSHSQTLSDLLVCTIYNYRVVSRDAAGNAATSTASTFLTTGCSGGVTPSTAASTVVTVSSAATTTVTDGNNTITVETPEDFTATSSSIVIQIKGLPSDTVLGSIGKPSSSLNSGASVVFDVKALIDNITELESFDVPVTISYTYSDGDISGLDESTLSMYHYANSAWSELDDCSVNTGTNTITCTAPHFSIFGIFGSPVSSNEESSSSSSGGTRFGCKDTNASNYEYFSRHKQELCRYDSVPVTASVCSPHIKTYIRYGAENDVEDVRKLETFLNEKQGESLIVDGVYGIEDVAAVKRFQQKFASEVLGVWGLNEPTGHVYRTTLMKINSFYCNASIICPAFTEYNSLTENSASAEVAKTKTLLLELGFYTGAINNTFDAQLNTSLRSFQETFSETMLKPWGLPYGTGYKYKTTNKFLNMLVGCQTPAVELDGKRTFDY